MPSEPTAQPSSKGSTEGKASRFRLAWLALGFVCVGLGGLGAFLPVLPTTPFLLVALWAFSRSSPRFHHWLYTHKRYGPRLQAWKEHGVVPVRVKVSALTAMVASLSVMVFVARVKWPVLAVTGVLMLVGATYVLSRPSRPPRTSVPEDSRERIG